MDAALEGAARLSRGVVRGLRLRPAGREAYVFCIGCERCTNVAGLDPGGWYALRLGRGRAGRVCETAPVGVLCEDAEDGGAQWLDFGGQDVALDATVFVKRKGGGDQVEGLDEKVAEFGLVSLGGDLSGGAGTTVLYRASLDVTQFLNWNVRSGVLEGVGGDSQAVIIPLTAVKAHRGEGGGGSGAAGQREEDKREPALLEITLKVVPGTAAALGYEPSATAGSRRASPSSSHPGTPTKGSAGVSPTAVAAAVQAQRRAQVQAQAQANSLPGSSGRGHRRGFSFGEVPPQAGRPVSSGAASPFAGLLLGRSGIPTGTEPLGRPPTPRGGLRRSPSNLGRPQPPGSQNDGIRPTGTASASKEGEARYLEGLLFDTKQKLAATERETERIRALVRKTEREIVVERSTAARLVASVQLYQQDLETHKEGRWARLKQRMRRRSKP